VQPVRVDQGDVRGVRAKMSSDATAGSFGDVGLPRLLSRTAPAITKSPRNLRLKQVPSTPPKRRTEPSIFAEVNQEEVGNVLQRLSSIRQLAGDAQVLRHKEGREQNMRSLVLSQLYSLLLEEAEFKPCAVQQRNVVAMLEGTRLNHTEVTFFTTDDAKRSLVPGPSASMKDAINHPNRIAGRLQVTSELLSRMFSQVATQQLQEIVNKSREYLTFKQTTYQMRAVEEGDAKGLGCLMRNASGIAIYKQFLLVTDAVKHCIWRVDTSRLTSQGVHEVRLFAGQEKESGSQDGALLDARFWCPTGIAVCDAVEQAFVCDTYNNCIRQVDLKAGTVLTLNFMSDPETKQLNAASFVHPKGICVIHGDRRMFVDIDCCQRRHQEELTSHSEKQQSKQRCAEEAESEWCSLDRSRSSFATSSTSSTGSTSGFGSSSEDNARGSGSSSGAVSSSSGFDSTSSEGDEWTNPGQLHSASYPSQRAGVADRSAVSTKISDGLATQEATTKYVIFNSSAGDDVLLLEGYSSRSHLVQQQPSPSSSFTSSGGGGACDLRSMAQARAAAAAKPDENSIGQLEPFRDFRLAVTCDHCVWYLDTSSMSARAIAGSALQSGYCDASIGSRARFSSPKGLVCIRSALFVADYWNNVLRCVNLYTTEVDTVVDFFPEGPMAMCVSDSGVLYVLDSENIHYCQILSIMATRYTGNSTVNTPMPFDQKQRPDNVACFSPQMRSNGSVARSERSCATRKTEVWDSIKRKSVLDPHGGVEDVSTMDPLSSEFRSRLQVHLREAANEQSGVAAPQSKRKKKKKKKKRRRKKRRREKQDMPHVEEVLGTNPSTTTASCGVLHEVSQEDEAKDSGRLQLPVRELLEPKSVGEPDAPVDDAAQESHQRALASALQEQLSKLTPFGVPKRGSLLCVDAALCSESGAMSPSSPKTRRAKSPGGFRSPARMKSPSGKSQCASPRSPRSPAAEKQTTYAPLTLSDLGIGETRLPRSRSGSVCVPDVPPSKSGHRGSLPFDAAMRMLPVFEKQSTSGTHGLTAMPLVSRELGGHSRHLAAASDSSSYDSGTIMVSGGKALYRSASMQWSEQKQPLSSGSRRPSMQANEDVAMYSDIEERGVITMQGQDEDGKMVMFIDSTRLLDRSCTNSPSAYRSDSRRSSVWSDRSSQCDAQNAQGDFSRRISIGGNSRRTSVAVSGIGSLAGFNRRGSMGIDDSSRRSSLSGFSVLGVDRRSSLTKRGSMSMRRDSHTVGAQSAARRLSEGGLLDRRGSHSMKPRGSVDGLGGFLDRRGSSYLAGKRASGLQIMPTIMAEEFGDVDEDAEDDDSVPSLAEGDEEDEESDADEKEDEKSGSDEESDRSLDVSSAKSSRTGAKSAELGAASIVLWDTEGTNVDITAGGDDRETVVGKQELHAPEASGLNIMVLSQVPFTRDIDASVLAQVAARQSAANSCAAISGINVVADGGSVPAVEHRPAADAGIIGSFGIRIPTSPDASDRDWRRTTILSSCAGTTVIDYKALAKLSSRGTSACGRWRSLPLPEPLSSALRGDGGRKYPNTPLSIAWYECGDECSVFVGLASVPNLLKIIPPKHQEPESGGRFSVLPVDSQRLLLVDESSHQLWLVSLPSRTRRLLAGSGKCGYVDGPLEICRMNSPCSAALDPHTHDIYVADRGNHVIRKINLSSGLMSTVAGSGVQGNRDSPDRWKQALDSPFEVSFSEPHSLIISCADNSVRSLNLRTGHLHTLLVGS